MQAGQRLPIQFQLLNIDLMEEGCFSSAKNGKASKSGGLSSRVALGLRFPVYIITASFRSSSLRELQKRLEQESVTLAFQSTLDRLEKVAQTHQRRFFLVLNDFKSTPQLTGEFLKLSCEVAQYPGLSLEQLMQCYWAFVEKEQKAAQDPVINQGELIFLSSPSPQRSVAPSSSVPGIQVRSISKMVYNYKSAFPKKLFVYANSHDDPFFLECHRAAEKYQIENAAFITRIEEYLKFLPAKEDVQFLVLMSEASALSLRKFFKKCDEIIVCTNNPEQCVPLLRGKVSQIICDLKSLECMLLKNFSVKPRSGENSLKPPEPSHVSNMSSLLALSSKLDRVSPCSYDNLKISQQFSLVSQTRKPLDLQSSIFHIVISPSSPSSDSHPTQENSKIMSNLSIVSPIREQPSRLPLEIVQLEHISLAACEHQDTSNLSNTQELFAEVLNTMCPSSCEKEKHLPPNKDSSDIENLKQSSSSFQSSGSRASQRSSRNSRLIERFKEIGKYKSRF